MAARLVEIYVPLDKRESVERVLEDLGEKPHWTDEEGSSVLFRLITSSERVEPLLDALQASLSGSAEFNAVVLASEASLPRPQAPATPEAAAPSQPPVPQRISREELYEDLEGFTKVTRVYLATVVLSSLVATIGLSRDSAAVVIGAMVIAPLLGPNMALALGSTLGDRGLVQRALKANLAGVALAFAASLAMGVFLRVDPLAAEIAFRTQVSLGDLVLALAAGASGALAFTSGLPAALVGVMVAVALLPPLSVSALLLVNGYPGLAFDAALLLGVNVVCVNLAGVAAFALQGIRPRTWWEAERSARATRLALLLWVGLLAVAVALIFVSQSEAAGAAGP